MTKIFTLYNHKGGVSKTTTTYHLAHALTEHLGKKVLVVDGDPQCNLTELCLFRIIEELDKREEKGEITALPGTTVKDALWPRLEGERAAVDVDAIELVKPNPDEELYVFRGDIALSEAEDRLSYAYSQRLTTDLHQKRNYVAVHDMLRRLGARENFDIILVDVGPSAGALTRNFFLACDAFFVPVAPDRFNYQAVASLSKILHKWISEHQQIIPDFSKLNLNVSTISPQFRGLIMQRYQRHKGVAKPSYQHWIGRIADRASKDLLPALVDAGTPDAVASECWVEPAAVEIPDFASLGPMMLSVGKPVWRLTQRETDWRGNVWEDRSAAMDDLKKLFFELAEKFQL